MIDREYQRLLDLIQGSLHPDKVPLEEILREAVVFFEVLRKEFPAAPREEREKMVQMMTHLHSRLKEISQAAAQGAGMSEEELAVFSENPNNFSPEQWQVVQETRKQLYDSARKFSSSLDKHKRENPQEKVQQAIRSKVRRSKKQDWTKS